MLRGIAAALAALVAIVAVWHPARVAVQTLLLLPALFPSAAVEPLALLTPAPAHEERTLRYTAGTIHVDLFHPASPGRHAAVVLLLGAGDVPRSDLALHFADSLARTGIAAMLPQSDGLLAERLTFDEVDGVRAELDLLDALPDVDPGRVGIIGLSAAGGLSIVAAGQPDLRNRIRLVNSFGSYADARTLLVDVGSRTREDGSGWQPEQRTVDVIAIALIDSLSDAGDQRLLRQAFVDHGAVDLSGLGRDGQLVRELLEGTTRDRAGLDVQALPPATQAALALISPSTYLSQVAAHLYVMHDVDDPFIPVDESRALVRLAPPGVVERYTEFGIFAHVIPDRPVPWNEFLPDVWRLFWHVHAVLLELI